MANQRFRSRSRGHGTWLVCRVVGLFTPREKRGVNKPTIRGTQREYSSKPLKHSIVVHFKRILVFEPGRYRHIFVLKSFHSFGFPTELKL